MLGECKQLTVFVFTLALFAAGMAKVSYADWSVGVSVGDPGYHHHDHDWDHDHGGWDHHWHGHPYWGYHEHFLPPDCYGVWVNGIKYHYCDGLYYTYAGQGDYVLVAPPMDAYVTSIPPDFQPVIINGVTYYSSDGIYYMYTPHGYRVVAQPVVYQQPAQVVVTQAPPVMVQAPTVTVTAGGDVGQNTFPVNIPNDNGSYTPVIITRSGSGYKGPQGEYYANFPSVAQLKVMYAKSK